MTVGELYDQLAELVERGGDACVEGDACEAPVVFDVAAEDRAAELREVSLEGGGGLRLVLR